ncbi:hypothetical protein AB0I94_35655 [Streptomyces sp. NPDC050147]|uniref:hypothetical protein n=1 Tax=Streptomyces sp. NPDC050147 TaxID=3155513 RepID=UPI00342132D1
MNRRPIRLLTAAITASAALLLTACGSGGDDKDSSDKIEGAGDGGSKASASAAPSNGSGKAGRPTIKLPSSFKMEFVGWTNSDPKLQAILDDGKEALRADHAAIIEGDPDASYVKFYNNPTSEASSKKWIKGFVDKDLTLTGEARISKPQVRINSTGSGILFYCMDESKGFTKNLKTKEVVGTPKDQSPRVQYQTRLDRTKDGVWKTSSSTTKRGGC